MNFGVSPEGVKISDCDISDTAQYFQKLQTSEWNWTKTMKLEILSCSLRCVFNWILLYDKRLIFANAFLLHWYLLEFCCVLPSYFSDEMLLLYCLVCIILRCFQLRSSILHCCLYTEGTLLGDQWYFSNQEIYYILSNIRLSHFQCYLLLLVGLLLWFCWPIGNHPDAIINVGAQLSSFQTHLCVIFHFPCMSFFFVAGYFIDG